MKKKARTPSRNYEKKAKAPNERNPILGKVITGTVEVVRTGNAYVISESGSADIFITKEDLGNAISGDKVQVRITYVSKSGKPEGLILEILNHAQTEFIGALRMSENYGFVIPDNPKIKFDIFIPKTNLGDAKDGDKVVAKVTDWSGDSKNPVGHIIENLASERDNQVAMKEILLEGGFKLRFSEAAIKESKKLSGKITDKEIAARKDCRDFPTFTIDPKDAKDFDDALSIRPLKDGYYEVGVHIADVSHFIKPGSALDAEAFGNATSVYLPDRVLPMLPEAISNKLCSLRPNEDKYTFSAIFQINLEGNIKQHWIGRTLINSNKRFTYEDTQAIIEGGEGDYKEETLVLNNIAKKLRAERFENGAINFSSQEIRFQLDEAGVPIGLEFKESKESHQLIEEFMLLANKYVAKFVQKRNINGQVIPFPYRVHPLPDEMKIAQFAQFAARFGYQLKLDSPEDIAKSLNVMLQQVKGKPEEHLLSELGIRTMSKAIYTTANEGHYGLGFEDYCHFTSPIRRYPDIMVHRIVQECIDGKMVMDKMMESKCKHSSERERKAMDCERKANKYKQVEYMMKFIGEELDAIVSGVSPNGFWAETIDQKSEGLINIADLAHWDHFDFIESDYALVGRKNGMRFRIGDKVRIKVENASLETKQIDYAFVSYLGKVEKSSNKKVKTNTTTSKSTQKPSNKNKPK